MTFEGYLLIHKKLKPNNHAYTTYIIKEKIKNIKYDAYNTAPIVIAVIAIVITLWQVLSDKEKYDLEKANKSQQEIISTQKQTIDILKNLLKQ